MFGLLTDDDVGKVDVDKVDVDRWAG